MSEAADGLPGSPEANETGTERSSIGRNLLSMMTSQLFTWVVATVVSVVIPRFLGPETLGEYRLAISLWLIVGVVTGLGTSEFLQLEVARKQSSGLALIGPVLVLTTLAFGASSIVVAGYVALTTDTTRFTVIVVLVGITTLLGVWSAALSATFLGLERMSAVAVAGAAGKLLFAIAAISVLLAGAGVYGVAAVGIGAAAIGLAYLLVASRRFMMISLRKWQDKALLVLRNSASYLWAGVALVTYQQIDLIVISRVAEKAHLGWYGAADTLFGSLLFPATVLLGVIFPTMGRLHQADPGELRHLVTRTFSILTILAVPIGLGTVIVAGEFAPLLYGEDFRETGEVLAVLGPVIVLTFGTILFGATALATGRTNLWVVVLFASALITVPLDIVLVPWANDRYDNGAIGGALAYIVTEGIQYTIGLWLIAPFLLTRELTWRMLRVIAAGGVMFAIGWPLRHMIPPIPIAACTVTYMVAVVALRVLGPEERRLIGDLLAKVGVSNGWAS